MFNRKKPLRAQRRSCRFALQRLQFGLSMSSSCRIPAALPRQHRPSVLDGGERSCQHRSGLAVLSATAA